MSQFPPLDYLGPLGFPFTPLTSDFIDASVFARFSQIVERYGSIPAVRDFEGVLSYDQLIGLTLRISTALMQRVSLKSPVAIALPTGRFYPAAMLGALAAGHPYVPMDLGFPAARLKHIITHAGAVALLTDAAGVSAFGPIMPEGTLLLDIHKLLDPPTIFNSSPNPDDIAYIIYTSGSTGTPKGVFQDQRGLLHDVMQYVNSIHLSALDCCTLLYSPSVGGAIRDIYGALLTGATLCIFDLRREGLRAVTEAISQWGVTIYHSMPPILRTLLRELPEHRLLAGIRLAYIAGDRLFASDVRLFRNAFSEQTLLYTGIGSTECATLYRQWFMPRDWPADNVLPPVGYAVPERNLALCNANGDRVAVGEVGEIVISSRFIARGYWNDQARTDASFTSTIDQPDIRRFHTGDLGRLREDGLLEFIGRADRQIKIRGYRVEPAEIEAALRDLSDVTDVAVIAHTIEHETILAAYVVVSSEGTTSAMLREAIAACLPIYMRPASIQIVKQLPTLGNFKTDLMALNRLNTLQLVNTDFILQAWEKVLGSAYLDKNLTFEAAGGDSLKALELHVVLEKNIGQRLPFDLIDTRVTIPQLRERLARMEVAERSTVGLPSLFIIPPFHKGVLKNLQFASDMEVAFKTEVIDLPSMEEEIIKGHTIRVLGDYCVLQILERLRPGEEINLMGISFGSRVAYEIACRLYEAGYPMGVLIIGDIPRGNAMRLRSKKSLMQMRYRIKNGLKKCLKSSGEWMVKIIHQCDWVSGREAMLHTIKIFLSKIYNEKKARSLLFNLVRDAQIDAWQPEPYAGPVLLLISDATRASCKNALPDLGWRSLCSNLTIKSVSGSHPGYLHPPYSAAVIEVITTYCSTILKPKTISDRETVLSRRF